MRQLRRIDSTKRSPIFAHLDESLCGVTSIKAFGRADEFVAKCDRLVDESQRAWYHVLISLRFYIILQVFVPVLNVDDIKLTFV